MAVADVDGACCAGSVSTPACIECMRVGVRYLSAASSASAAFVAPSVSVSVAEGIGGGVNGGGCVAGTGVCDRSMQALLASGLALIKRRQLKLASYAAHVYSTSLIPIPTHSDVWSNNFYITTPFFF